MFILFRVSGHSMTPALDADDYVVAAPWLNQPRAGQLAVLQHPRYGKIVKRAVKKDCRGYWFESDHGAGVTETQMGAVAGDQILGRVILTIKQKGGIFPIAFT